MSQQETLPISPFDRPELLGIPPAVRAMQERYPASRFRTMAGDEAWMVTRHDTARRLFADPRLTRSHPDPRNAPKVTNSALLDGSDWGYEDSQAEERAEARMRALLSRSFSARRMAALEPRVAELVDELLSGLAAAGPPADLCWSLTRPLPMRVIFDLLGIPGADRGRFQEWFQAVIDPVDATASRDALHALYGYMMDLLARKATDPGEDVMSDLAAACAAGTVSTMEATAMATGVLFAGHSTTVVVMEWGLLHLMLNPDQCDRLRSDRTLVAGAVEEILRTRVSGGESLAHYAREDIELDGVTIRAGDAVVINVIGANHDPRVFPDPDRFNISRRPNPHLAFGHGRHTCIGRSLARIELRVVFGMLVERFPGLRLGVPVERLRPHRDVVLGGLDRLPVVW